MSKEKDRDWRTQYVVCEHIAADENLDPYHYMFRVCCKACADKGWLYAELEKREQGKLCIGKVKPK